MFIALGVRFEVDGCECKYHGVKSCAVSIVQDTEDRHNDTTECQTEEKSSAPPRDALFSSVSRKVLIVDVIRKIVDK